MKNRARIVSFLNQKGGVGKSTLTALESSFLHEKGFKVLVIDADEEQTTMKVWQKEDHGNKIETYDIINVLSRDVPEVLEENLEEYDYIFIDFPGNTEQKGVKECFPFIDVCLVPFYPNVEEIDSTIKFYDTFATYQEIRVSNGQNKTNLMFFFYRVGITSDGKELIKEIEDSGLKLMQNTIKHYDKMRHRSSTINRLNKESYYYKIDRFLEECTEIINNTNIKNY